MNYYDEIKNKLINNEMNRKVKNYSINRSDLNTYYNVGKMLSEAGKHYDDSIIKEYSKRLTNELGKGYSKRNLWLMLRYFEQKEKMQTVSAQLSWSHYCEILWFDESKFIYYVKVCSENNLSIRQLRERIKLNEYERLDDVSKRKLLSKAETNVIDFVKDPILIKNSYNYENISEKLLQKLILEDITSFMKELGQGK